MGCEYHHVVRKKTSDSRKALASQVWRLMSDFCMGQFGRRSGMLGGLGLTPGHMKALMLLEPGEAHPMGWCAQQLGCDASTATWLIDRLEERGFVERRESKSDRRVKAVVLTPSGKSMRAKVQTQFYEPPDELLDLDQSALTALLDALEKVATKPPHN